MDVNSTSMVHDDSSLTLELDDFGLAEFLKAAANFGTDKYAYVVTPNVDHLIRLCDDAAFRDMYRKAGYVLMDSRFLAGIMRLFKGVHPRPCPGSDITARLFDSLVQPDDTVVLIGAADAQAQALRATYGLKRLRHFNPPMGFIHDPAAVEACLDYIEAQSPFRYCLLAVGSPQQEKLAKALLARGQARGLALCIGASIDFLTGVERRAPEWMQHLALEWLYRLVQNPGRMAHRYLVRGPRIFFLLPRIAVALRRQQPHAPAPLTELATTIEPTRA